jgi:hypothetical protein
LNFISYVGTFPFLKHREIYGIYCVGSTHVLRLVVSILGTNFYIFLFENLMTLVIDPGILMVKDSMIITKLIRFHIFYKEIGRSNYISLDKTYDALKITIDILPLKYMYNMSAQEDNMLFFIVEFNADVILFLCSYFYL